MRPSCSAVVSAYYRLAETAGYLLSEDTTCCVSGMSLWCISEQMCAKVVFSAPNIPRIVRETSLWPVLQFGLRSIFNLCTASSSHNFLKPPWRGQKKSRSGNSVYQEVGHSGVPLAKMGVKSVSNSEIFESDMLN
jgi:hypothetical protein